MGNHFRVLVDMFQQFFEVHEGKDDKLPHISDPLSHVAFQQRQIDVFLPDQRTHNQVQLLKQLSRVGAIFDLVEDGVPIWQIQPDHLV